MNILPESTFLGILKIIEVYEYYDIACLFSCRNNTGQIFIAVWIDENKDNNEWLFTPVSNARFKLIESGKIDLRNAFLKSENDFVFKVILSKFEKLSDIQNIHCSKILEEWLPESDQFLRSEIESSSENILNILKTKAISYRREILRLKLDFANEDFFAQNEAPLKEWGNILVSLQELFDAIGQLKKGIPTANGGVSQEIKTESRFNVMAVSTGSFITEIAAAELGDLFNESLANEIIQEFIQIISHSDNQEELTKIIKYFQLRAARKYRDFLIELQTAGTQISIDWVSPLANKGASVILKETTIQNAIIIIDQVESELPEVISIIGTLIGGNERSEKFEMIDKNEQTYKGDISKQVINSSISLTIGNKYEFIIEATKKIKPATNEIFYSYKLIGLKQLMKKD
jgi:hypothetical protein